MAKTTTEFNLSTPKSYASLIYGAITVAVIFLILFFGVRAIQQRQAITPEAEETTAAQTYEVKEGDSLWTIAEMEYKDGYKWTEIAKANKIENPNIIEKGMKLTVPEIAKAEVKEEEVKMEAGEKITGTSYKVIEGDNLWDISVRAYGDGYKWVELAKDNKLVNPDLIYPDDTLNLPR